MRKSQIQIGTPYHVTIKGRAFTMIPLAPARWEPSKRFDCAYLNVFDGVETWHPFPSVGTGQFKESVADRDARAAAEQAAADEREAVAAAVRAERRDRLDRLHGDTARFIKAWLTHDDDKAAVDLRWGWGPTYGDGEQPELRVYVTGYYRAAQLVVEATRILGRPLTAEPLRSSAAGPALVRLAAGLPADPEDTWRADVEFTGADEIAALHTAASTLHLTGAVR